MDGCTDAQEGRQGPDQRHPRDAPHALASLTDGREHFRESGRDLDERDREEQQSVIRKIVRRHRSDRDEQPEERPESRAQHQYRPDHGAHVLRAGRARTDEKWMHAEERDHREERDESLRPDEQPVAVRAQLVGDEKRGPKAEREGDDVPGAEKRAVARDAEALGSPSARGLAHGGVGVGARFQIESGLTVDQSVDPGHAIRSDEERLRPPAGQDRVGFGGAVEGRGGLDLAGSDEPDHPPAFRLRDGAQLGEVSNLARAGVHVSGQLALGARQKEACSIFESTQPDLGATDVEVLLERILRDDPLVRGRVCPQERGCAAMIRRDIHDGKGFGDGPMLAHDRPHALIRSYRDQNEQRRQRDLHTLPPRHSRGQRLGGQQRQYEQRREGVDVKAQRLAALDESRDQRRGECRREQDQPDRGLRRARPSIRGDQCPRGRESEEERCGEREV